MGTADGMRIELMEIAEQLRRASEDDVLAALQDSYVSFPLETPAAALEFFNRMLDQILGEGEDTTSRGARWRHFSGQSVIVVDVTRGFHTSSERHR